MVNLDIKRVAFEEMEVITIGFPFCFFKGLCGLFFLQNDYRIAGLFLLVLAAIDLLINLANFFWLFIFRSRFLGTCFFNISAGFLGKLFDSQRIESWKNIGSSLDVLFSFILVAGMVGLGGLKYLSPVQLNLWNLSVVLNVLGAGLGRIAESLLKL